MASGYYTACVDSVGSDVIDMAVEFLWNCMVSYLHTNKNIADS